MCRTAQLCRSEENVVVVLVPDVTRVVSDDASVVSDNTGMVPDGITLQKLKM